MKENKNFYLVKVYTIDTESNFYNSSGETFSMSKFISKCSKKGIVTLIVYKTLWGKFKEIITDIEIAALWEDDYGEDHLTKNIPLFFCFSKRYNRKKLNTMLATSLDIEDYVDKNLNKKEYENYNSMVNKKDMFSKELLELIENAKEEFIKYANNKGVIVRGMNKLQKEKNKELVKKINSLK